MIFKRTFEALKYPQGSKERAELNKSGITSEYMPSYTWQTIGENYSLSFRSKEEAEEHEKHFNS